MRLSIKFILTVGVFLSFFGCVKGQNLVPNPGFETYSVCPNGMSGIGDGEAPPWVDGNGGNSDYFHICSWSPSSSVPDNLHGFQWPLSGDAYSGFVLKNTILPADFHEYIQVQLLEPLQSGVTYEVAFYVNLANPYCGIERIGALFTTSAPPHPPGHMYLDYVPQIESNVGFISDTIGWTFIYDCFVAQGGEEFLTIGNFQPNTETEEDPDCSTNFSTVYYYVDDVSVKASVPAFFDFELGGPINTCGFYNIDPELPEAFHTWSDGSHNATLTVSESGIYSVTITDGCFSAEDEIEINILDTEPVDIPEEEVTICLNEVFTIMLDPDAGSYIWNDGTTNPVYDIFTSGLFVVTLDDGCNLSTDSIMVYTSPSPEPFSLGNDTILCEGESQTLVFDTSLGDFFWQNGSTEPVYTIHSPGLYSLTISNECGEFYDDILVEFLNPPDINLGPDTLYLCDDEFFDLDFDPSIGEYAWQDGSSTSYYHFDQPGEYSVTVTNFCGTASDELVIEQNQMPSVDLGTNVSACYGDTIILDGGEIIAMYEWQDGSGEQTYEVTTSGIYAVTITNDCGTAIDSVDVTFAAPISTPDLGPDIVLCPGDEMYFTVQEQGAFVQWSDMSVNDSLLVTTAGEYFVQVFNNCESFSDTVIVTVSNQPPSIDLPAQLNLCSGQTLVIDPMINGVSYAWSTGSDQPTLMIDTPGSYALTISNTCGAAADTIIVMDGGVAPLVSLGQDTAICKSASWLLQPQFTNVDSWIWQDMSSVPEYLVTASDTLFITAFNLCGQSTDTLIVDALPDIPQLYLGADTSLCASESLTLSIPFSNVGILWSDQSTQPDFIITAPGTYFGSIENECGISSDTIVVTALPSVPVLQLGPDIPLCPGQMIEIDPGIADVAYVWQDGSTMPVYQTDQAGTIILEISNECGVSTDTLEVFISTDGPLLDLGPDLTACEGEVVTIESQISGVEYEWQDGSASSDFLTSQSGTFILMVSNACGTDTDTVIVTIDGQMPAVELGVDTTICEGEILVLQLQSATGSSISWQDGSAEDFFEVSMAGMYAVTVSNQCGSDADTIQVSLTPLPEEFTLGPDQEICEGDTIELTIPAGIVDPYQWSTGDNNASILVTQSGTYSLTTSNACGTAEDAVVVEVLSESIVFPPTDELLLCPGENVTLNALQSIAASYEWSTGATTSQITVSTPDMYSVTVFTTCETAQHVFEVLEEADCFPAPEIYVPDIISPNGDQINDVFSIIPDRDTEILSVEGSIYDRWGNLVFHSREHPFVWDGTFNGEPMMPGVYVYSIIITYLANGQQSVQALVGDVTLVR